jgi:hypothetical protein
MPARHRVLVPEHEQPGIFDLVTAEQQDGRAEYPARQQADDLEQHPGCSELTVPDLCARRLAAGRPLAHPAIPAAMQETAAAVHSALAVRGNILTTSWITARTRR